MLVIEKHANAWMLVRKNSEGTFCVVKSFKTEAAATKAKARLA